MYGVFVIQTLVLAGTRRKIKAKMIFFQEDFPLQFSPDVFMITYRWVTKKFFLTLHKKLSCILHLFFSFQDKEHKSSLKIIKPYLDNRTWMFFNI